MAINSTNVLIQASTHKVEYELRQLFFFKWWKEIKAERFGKDLYINTEPVEEVFINGVEYKPVS